MLQGILLNIKDLLKSNNLLDDKKLEKFLEFLKWYNKDEYIYPGVLMSNLDVTSDEAYNILKVLENSKIVSKSFEVYCHKCERFKGKIYDSFSDIPDEAYCDNCNVRLDPLMDTIVIYRIINDGR